MKRLMDIAPADTTKASVTVGGEEVEVGRISARRLTALLMRFPELGDLMSGKKVAPMRLIEIGVDAAAAVIAEGCGYRDNPEAEAFVADMDIPDQLKLIEAIAVATLPNMAGPLIAQFKSRVENLLVELQKPEAATPPTD